jgi:hypothetical protein
MVAACRYERETVAVEEGARNGAEGGCEERRRRRMRGTAVELAVKREKRGGMDR